jgi:multidrug efflux system membrane fusion protein
VPTVEPTHRTPDQPHASHLIELMDEQQKHSETSRTQAPGSQQPAGTQQAAGGGKRHRGRTIGLIVAALVVAGIVLVRWHPWGGPAGGAQAPNGASGPRAGRGGPGGLANLPQPVHVATATQGEMPVVLTALGTVTPLATVTVQSQLSGTLQTVAFEEGQMVKKGDLLAQIDPRPYQAQIEQFTANRDRDQAQLANAQANLNRYTPLEQKGFATEQLLDTQKAQVAQLDAAVKADQALIDAANVQLSYTRLTSPIDGVVGIRQIDVGNIISPSTTNGLVVVTQLQPISLIFTLPETDLPRIQQQQELSKEPLTVLAFSQDNTIKLDQGTLGLVNNEILQTTGSIQLKANFPNADHRLWPGELVNARLLLNTRHDGLTVPASVVQQGPQGPYAYVINPDSSVAIRPVKVAQISDGQALIDSGLEANEQVVVDGQYKLQPGTHVRILHGKAAEEAAAQNAQQATIP